MLMGTVQRLNGSGGEIDKRLSMIPQDKVRPLSKDKEKASDFRIKVFATPRMVMP